MTGSPATPEPADTPAAPFAWPAEPATEATPVAAALVPSPAPEAFLYTIGDIGVTPTYVVTPNGNCLLSESTWLVRDDSRTVEKIPTSSIVLAVIFFAVCLLGLLFLLKKETTTTGYVEVTVRGGNLFHVIQIPITRPDQVAAIRAQVNQVQSLATQR